MAAAEKKTVFLILIIITIVYSNTATSAWHFDDYPNIVKNPSIHINTLDFESIWIASFAKDGHYNYRPLPNLSFGINWFIGGSDATNYHILNIFIHICSAIMLFFTFIALFETVNLRKKFDINDVCFISTLATLLWALNPVQTQAVTYIVQRMTIMGAFFYISSILFYIKARIFYNFYYVKKDINNHLPISIPDRKTNRTFFCSVHCKASLLIVFNLLFCLVCIICALLSKENTATVPIALLMVELVFFRNIRKIKFYFREVITFLLIIIVVPLAYVFFLKQGDFLFFLRGYSYRDFSAWERILTEPRVILHYISQIFYPLPERFSLIHDFTISRNLFQPWTTIPSILTIIGIIFFGFFQLKKRPIFSFAILFFFLNHIIESTFIPLELVFEHRNYLPTMFLFLPVAMIVVDILNKNRHKKNVVYFLVLIAVPIVLIWFGISTYIRNSVWQTELSLWHDAYKKAPYDARPSISLATAIAFRDNASPRDFDVALKLLEHSLSLNKPKNNMNAEIYGNIALIYYKMNQFEKSIEFHRKSLDVNPDFIKGRFDLVKCLVKTGDWNQASKEMDIILSYRGNYLSADHFKVKGHILLWQNKPEMALRYFREAFRMNPVNHDYFLDIGKALSMNGNFHNAGWFLRLYNKNNNSNMLAYFCLIENCMKSGQINAAEKYAEKMIKKHDIVSIINTIKSLSSLYQSVPVSADIIKPVIMNKIAELSGCHYDHTQV